MVKVIVGARRTGKTTMLAKEIEKINKPVYCYFRTQNALRNLESMTSKNIEPAYTFDFCGIENVVLVIDNFDLLRSQEKFEFFENIRLMDMRNIDVYATLTPGKVYDKENDDLTYEAKLVLNFADEVKHLRPVGLMEREYFSSEQYIHEILGKFTK